MPLIRCFTTTHGAVVSIWKITETTEQLLSMLHRHDYFIDKISSLSPGSRRIKEVLSVRLLLKEICGKDRVVLYDSWGRPFLGMDEIGDFYSLSQSKIKTSHSDTTSYKKKYCCNYDESISITHTEGYAAVIYKKDLNILSRVGVDIERIGIKVSRVVSRFLSKTELNFIGDDPLAWHIAWSAKETAFKILGHDFYDLQHKTQIVHYDLLKGSLTLAVFGGRFLKMNFVSTSDYVLVWSD